LGGFVSTGGSRILSAGVGAGCVVSVGSGVAVVCAVSVVSVAVGSGVVAVVVACPVVDGVWVEDAGGLVLQELSTSVISSVLRISRLKDKPDLVFCLFKVITSVRVVMRENLVFFSKHLTRINVFSIQGQSADYRFMNHHLIR
jgi:hypothetical protein